MFEQASVQCTSFSSPLPQSNAARGEGGARREEARRGQCIRCERGGQGEEKEDGRRGERKERGEGRRGGRWERRKRTDKKWEDRKRGEGQPTAPN